MATGNFFSALFICLPSTACSSLFDLVVFQAAQAAAQGVGNGIQTPVASIIITAVVLAVMIPSGYMASGLVRQEIFNTKANSAIATAQQQEGFFVLRKILNHRENMVGLIVNGTGNAEKISALLVKSLNASGVKEPKVKVVYAGGDDAKIEELLASRNNPIQQQNELKEQQAYIDAVLADKASDIMMQRYSRN